MKLLALDPGGTTGWSLWEYGHGVPLTHVAHGQIGGGVDGFVRWWLDAPVRWDQVVSESFVLDGRTAFPDVTPLRIEGALVAFGARARMQRNTMKKHGPDELLKAHGIYWPGEPHAVDSARHALAFVKIDLHMSSMMHFWPPRPRPVDEYRPILAA